MDAFEQVVSEILWMDGHWVRTSVKVDLAKEEKVLIGRPSSPRWELDIVGYSGRDNVFGDRASTFWFQVRKPAT
jgi:hypothetical protein